MARAFSPGPEPLKIDFSEKVNTKEITLKTPSKLKKMNMCSAITNALDIALATIPR
jgi:hypothetical protein